MTPTERQEKYSAGSRNTIKKNTVFTSFQRMLILSGVCFVSGATSNILVGITPFAWFLYGFGALMALLVFTMAVIIYFRNPDDLKTEEHIEEVMRIDQIATKDDDTTTVVVEIQRPDDTTQITGAGE